ncbi:hypothetical protein IJU97_05735 [bacterium]|nr:hypothetical protein [bacterium]
MVGATLSLRIFWIRFTVVVFQFVPVTPITKNPFHGVQYNELAIFHSAFLKR